jgi:outer membrane protein assembly factor BamA
LRYRIAEQTYKQDFLVLHHFFDAGTVRDEWRNLNFKNIRYSYGLGSRIA